MLVIIVIMLSGMAGGFLLRRYRISWMSRLINVLIWALLFLLGIEVGSDPRIVQGLFTLGWEAIVISMLCTIGSCAAAWVLWRCVRHNTRQAANEDEKTAAES